MSAHMDMEITAAGIATVTPHGHFMDFMTMHGVAICIMPHMGATPTTAMDTIAMDTETGGDITNGGGQAEMIIKMILRMMEVA